MKLGKVILTGLTTALFSSVVFASGHAHWGYTGHNGPENWGDLDPKYSMCKKGSSQSPINITKEVSVIANDLEVLSFKYATNASSVVNNGHTIQVNIVDGSDIEVDGIKFALKQFHFHTPSENQIDNKHFPLEAHFVHASKDGQLAVVAVMFEEGKENQILKKIWDRMPTKSGESNRCGLPAKTINEILPKKREYYRFNGSLTTPPCSEGVRWMVMKDYSTISAAQVKQFLDVMHHENNRPVQPVNARKIIK